MRKSVANSETRTEWRLAYQVLPQRGGDNPVRITESTPAYVTEYHFAGPNGKGDADIFYRSRAAELYGETLK